MLQKSVALAVEARDKFWDKVSKITGHSYNRALVAASIGSYGAYLADGSEYRCLFENHIKQYFGFEKLIDVLNRFKILSVGDL